MKHGLVKRLLHLFHRGQIGVGLLLILIDHNPELVLIETQPHEFHNVTLGIANGRELLRDDQENRT